MANMLSQLHTNYYAANTTYGLQGVAPVGDAFANAISDGWAEGSIYTAGTVGSNLKFSNGKFTLWYFNPLNPPSAPYPTGSVEGYHPSIYGAYLSAAVHIEKITGFDPRNISTGAGSAAADLGIADTDAAHLNAVAWETTSVAPTITNGPTTSTGMVGTAYNFSYQASAALPAATSFSLTSGTLPQGLNLTTTGVISGTPTVQGVYTGTISDSNGFGTAATQTFNIAIASTYSQWAANYGVGGINAVPQNDGISNLQKYAANIDPTKIMTIADRAALPTIGAAAGGTQLTLTYRVSRLAIGITMTPQTSTDLQNWSTVSTITQTGTDMNTGDPIYQAIVNTTGSNRQFIRLKISMP